MERLAHSNIRFGESNLNYFGKHFPWSVAWPVKTFMQNMRKAGGEAMQWHPLEGILSPVAGAQFRLGVVSDYELAWIDSMHQSIRNEKNIAGKYNPNRLIATVTTLSLPETKHSFDDMHRIQDLKGGHRLPVVVYPDTMPREIKQHNPFGELSWQPNNTSIRHYKAESFADLWEKAQTDGISQITPDTTKLLEEGAEVLRPVVKVLPLMLENADSLHLSVGRIDSNTIDKKATMRDLRALYYGNDYQATIVKMLKLIKDEGWKGTMYLEVPVDALYELHREAGEKMRYFSPKQVVQDKKRIFTNTGNYLHGTQAA